MHTAGVERNCPGSSPGLPSEHLAACHTNELPPGAALVSEMGYLMALCTGPASGKGARREDAAGSVDGREGSFSISRGRHWEKHEKSHHSKPHALWSPQAWVLVLAGNNTRKVPSPL